VVIKRGSGRDNLPTRGVSFSPFLVSPLFLLFMALLAVYPSAEVANQEKGGGFPPFSSLFSLADRFSLMA